MNIDFFNNIAFELTGGNGSRYVNGIFEHLIILVFTFMVLLMIKNTFASDLDDY